MSLLKSSRVRFVILVKIDAVRAGIAVGNDDSDVVSVSVVGVLESHHLSALPGVVDAVDEHGVGSLEANATVVVVHLLCSWFSR